LPKVKSLQLACLHDQNKSGFCGEMKFLEYLLLSIQSEQFHSLEKALIEWKKVGLPKKPLCFLTCRQAI